MSKQDTVRPVWARLKPVFDSVILLAEFRARSKEITVETDIAPDLPPLLADVKEMKEVLMQLLTNAIKFNRPGGKIWLAARADAGSIILTVADAGVGNPPEKLVLILDVFEQGANPLR